ncbi:VOC family protein, partial [Xanthomonas campestris]
MSQAASAGLFIYAKDLERVAAFYQRLLGMQAIHSSKELVVLNAAALQLVIHAVPEAIAASIAIADPPSRRENTALKFFFTVPSIAQLAELAAALGGEILLSASRKIDPAITRGLRHTSHQGDHQC